MIVRGELTADEVAPKAYSLRLFLLRVERASRRMDGDPVLAIGRFRRSCNAFAKVALATYRTDSRESRWAAIEAGTMACTDLLYLLYATKVLKS